MPNDPQRRRRRGSSAHDTGHEPGPAPAAAPAFAAEVAAPSRSETPRRRGSCRAPPAGQPPASPQPKKGKRPTHELTRVIEVDGRKAYQPVGVLWLRENGRGFVKLKADLKAGDTLMVAPLTSGGAS